MGGAGTIAVTPSFLLLARYVQHWADGGDTSLPNLTILCRTHHTATHKQDHPPPNP